MQPLRSLSFCGIAIAAALSFSTIVSASSTSNTATPTPKKVVHKAALRPVKHAVVRHTAGKRLAAKHAAVKHLQPKRPKGPAPVAQVQNDINKLLHSQRFASESIHASIQGQVITLTGSVKRPENKGLSTRLVRDLVEHDHWTNFHVNNQETITGN